MELRRHALQRDEAAEPHSDIVDGEKRRVHRMTFVRNAPDALGQNSTNSTKMDPTMICQCERPQREHVLHHQEHQCTDERAEEAAGAAQQQSSSRSCRRIDSAANPAARSARCSAEHSAAKRDRA